MNVKASEKLGSNGAIRRFLAGLALVLAFSVSTLAGQAAEACCPMAASDAPCHAEMIGDCRSACALCQTQAPRAPDVAISCARIDLCHAALVGTAPDQILAQPATPPPRG